MTWHTCGKPDSDTTVLMRLAKDSEYPLWPGYHDGEQWREADGASIEESAVLGWMDLDEAAERLAGYSEAVIAMRQRVREIRSRILQGVIQPAREEGWVTYGGEE